MSADAEVYALFDGDLVTLNGIDTGVRGAAPQPVTQALDLLRLALDHDLDRAVGQVAR